MGGCLAYRRFRVASPWKSWLLHLASYIDDDQTDDTERCTGRSNGNGIGALPSVTGKAEQQETSCDLAQEDDEDEQCLRR